VAILSAIVECPRCGCEYSGVWAVSGDIQDMAEAPVSDKECPGCGHIIKAMEYPGWTWMTEAG
jgi:hypothetical protein